MDNENFEQQELFKQEKYISDLLEQKTPKNKSSLNTIFGSSILTSIIVLSFLYVYGIFDENEIIIPDPVTITETVTETEVIMPRIDSTEIVSIAEIATKTIVQIQVGQVNENDEFISLGGRMYKAEIIGSDKLTDIGLVKIESSSLTPIVIGNSDILLVGDLAVAIGHPLTLGAAPTVTTGIVSALERRLDVGGQDMNSSVTLFGLIQTDAPITRGSSGGALLNQRGELIGITTAIATADVGAEGLGFAVPINLALNISQDLIDDGKVYHSFLGILGAQHFEVAEDGARIFSGVEIQELYGPANDIYAIGKAGALPGDIIKKVNGKNIKTLDGLISFLRGKKAGDEISIEIIRNGQTITLEFLLDLRPSDV